MQADAKSTLTEIGLNPHLLDLYPETEDWRDGLSRRDIGFCYLLAKGFDRVEAYQLAYSANIPSISGLRDAANRKLKYDVILKELVRLSEDKSLTKRPVRDAWWVQSVVLDEMLDIVCSKKNETRDRVRAGEVVLRHVGMAMLELAKVHPDAVQKLQSPIEELEKMLRENNKGKTTKKPDEELSLN